MKKILVTLTALLMVATSVSAEGLCIRLKNGKLSSKSTTKSSCSSGQAFVPKVAGVTGATGATGAAGTAGTARAYGFVGSNGNLDLTKSSSNVSARKSLTGFYCISATGIDPTTVMPVVTADQDVGAGSYHIAQVKSLYSGVQGCTASEWGIATVDLLGSSQTAANIAFSFVIP